jgi:hypothetical protein
MESSAIWNNEVGSTFNAQSNNQIIYGQSGTPLFNNMGTFLDSNSASGATADVIFNDTGALGGSTLLLEEGGSVSSGATIAAGATLDVNAGTITLSSAALGAGTLELDGGAITASGTVSVSVLNVEAGTLTNNGTFTVNGSFYWSGGNLAGSGTEMIQCNSTVGVADYVYLESGTLDNYGIASWTGDYS